MKISNETKVGALTAIAIVILILGFNFLKGRNITERNDTIYTVFEEVKGLQVSNPVFINGLQVGKIKELKEKDKQLSGIVVALDLTKDIDIPTDSKTIINSDFLGTTSLEIQMGAKNGRIVKTGDTLQSSSKPGIVGEFSKSLNPAINNINKTLASLDILIQQLNNILDPKTQGNLQTIIATLNTAVHGLDKLIVGQSGVIGKALTNVEHITGAFAQNSGKIDTTFGNLQKISDGLVKADLEKTLKTVGAAMTQLQQTITTINSRNGSVGMLLNDRQFYDELRLTNRSLTTLLDDLRLHPKRYVSVSVFGRKNKTEPITQPVTIDTVGGK
jgi:phospholipid/cholesterol/gamma-HCH transport system substrate-binding protein